MKAHSALKTLIAVACTLCQAPASALDVTLDAGGSGSVTISDTDMDHIIDFDETVGGVFHAKGRVRESLGTITNIVTLTSTPPDTEAIFENLGMGSGTAAFTVTVNTSSFAATGLPLGWTASYVGSADDAMGGAVDIPSHSVAVSINGGTIPLTTLTGSPIIAPTAIDLESSGANPSDSATDVRVVFSFAPGPDDEIRLPDNNGFDHKSIEVDVFNQSHSCVDRMNNGARRVARTAENSDTKCLKRGTGDVTACVDDPLEPKTQNKEQKLLADFATFCVPVPAWGVNGTTCCDGGSNDGSPCAAPAACPGGSCVGGACISAAAERGAGAITHDLFGATVNVASDRVAAKCQNKVMKLTGRVYIARWKAFRKCKKDNFSLITGDADLVTVCLGPPQSDARNIISRRQARLADRVQSQCVGHGVTPVGAQFAGLCSAAADGVFADCVSARVACRFCQAANVADRIVPPLDCDGFDDGVSNSSCTP